MLMYIDNDDRNKHKILKTIRALFSLDIGWYRIVIPNVFMLYFLQFAETIILSISSLSDPVERYFEAQGTRLTYGSNWA